MKKIVLLIIFLIINFSQIFAQQPTKYLEDKGSGYFALLSANAIGKYKKTLQATETNTSNMGVVFGYLWNPFRGKKPSPVFYGLEFGYQSGGTDNVTAYIDGSFAARYNNYWLNGVARYRPILGSTKLNPYVDAFFGGKVISTNVLEYLTQDESESLDIYSSLVPNYGVGIGTGVKLSGNLKNAYLDIGFYYQQADPTKIVKRNSVVINQNLTVDYKTIPSNTNHFLIKIGLTGFFAN